MPIDRKRDFPIRPIPLSQVTVNDPFWEPRLAANRNVTLPSSLAQCHASGRIGSFSQWARSSAAVSPGRPYDDSDVYKVIEAIAYILAVQKNSVLRREADAVIAKIASAQLANGYLNTHFSRGDADDATLGEKTWGDLSHSHELYCAGHLIEAGVAYYEATGTRQLLDVAIRNADHIVGLFGPDKRHDVPGHPEIELALTKLFRVTNNQKYLLLAQFFLDERGKADNGRHYGPVDDHFDHVGEYAQDHQPLEQQDRPVGHAVRACYLYAGAVEVAALTGNTNRIGALERIWQNMVSAQIYLTGGVGSRHEGEAFDTPYKLPNRTAYNETCAAIANVFWNHRMFLQLGDGKYIDLLERILYNGLLAGVSMEGDTFFYPNPLAADGEFKFNKGTRSRQPWFECACCPTNVARFIPTLAGYAYAQRDSNLYVNLYLASETRFDVGEQSIGLRQDTLYPWSGRVVISIKLETPATFTLYLRMPGWMRGKPMAGDLYGYVQKEDASPQIRIDGKPLATEQYLGFAVIERTWHDRDQIEIDFPMPVRRVVSDRQVTENRGRVALERGPLVYCAEGIDHGGSVSDLTLPDREEFSFRHQSEFLGGVTTLHGRAQKNGREVDFCAIPYYAWAHRGPGEMAVWLKRQMA